MKLVVFFLVPISAWLPTCNRKVVITHTEYDGNHKLAININPHIFQWNKVKLFFNTLYNAVAHGNLWGSRERDHFGTHSSYDLEDDQIWTLECDHNEGYFYIVNYVHDVRLVQWGEDIEDIGFSGGRKSNDQLWEIYGNETSGYVICNYKYYNHCLTKWGLDDDEVGTVMVNRGIRVDQPNLWHIAPLYSNPRVKWNRIEEIDNTKGEQIINLTVKYEVGVSSSTTDTISAEFGTELSLAVETLGSIGASIKTAIESSITNGRTETHTKTHQFKVDPGENWWLCQGTATLDSWAGREDVQIISGKLKINSDLC